ncbi:MAG: DUF2232 domain-containing protein [Ruminococcaceae bacterium]|nr:DUF2232 domain-containing protein [Oscillospiraceae bacterium]
MKNELKKNLTYEKTMLILSVLCIASGFLTLIISDAAIPITAALLAAIFLFESKGKRRFSYAVSAILVVINAALFLVPDMIPSFFSILAIAFAVIISRAYLRGSEKSETAFLMTAAATLVITLTLIVVPMIAAGKLDFGVVKSFYEKLISLLREELLLAMDTALGGLEFQGTPVMIDVVQINKLFDYQLSMFISYVIIFAFFLAGATLKFFSIVVSKCAENVKPIFMWRFKTSSVFAYFYFILAVATFFIASADSVFSITVLNLYNILMFVYFYVGFNVAVAFMSRNRRPIFAFLIVLLAVILFMSYAIELLAIIGAFFTIKSNQHVIKSE